MSGRQRRSTSLMRSLPGSDSGDLIVKIISCNNFDVQCTSNTPSSKVIIIEIHWWGHDTECGIHTVDGTWVSDFAQALLFSFGPCPTFTRTDHYFQPFRSCPSFLMSAIITSYLLDCSLYLWSHQDLCLSTLMMYSLFFQCYGNCWEQ